MMQVSLKISPVKNWRESVEKSMTARVRYEMFYRTCSSKKRRCWQKGLLLAEMAVRFYLSKTPIVTRLQVSCMIFLLVEIPSISNPVRWSNWAKKLLVCEQMSAMKCFAFSKKFLNVSALMRLRLPMMLGLSAIWTWFVPRSALSKKGKQSYLSYQKIRKFNCSMSAILWSKMPSQMMSILVKI